MIIGILSDTHGFADRAAVAVALLERLGATAFLHCGDIGDEAVLDVLAGKEAWCVLGNTDADTPSFRRYAETIGVRLAHGPLEIELARKKLAVFHGHESRFNRLVRALETEDPVSVSAAAPDWNYVCFGHTHRATDLRVGNLRLINPGALERVRVRTVATLNVNRDELAFWETDEFAAPEEPPRRVYPRDLE